MKHELSLDLLPRRAVFVTCSSSENRCLGFLSKMNEWKPLEFVIFHHDDTSSRRNDNYIKMKAACREMSIESIDIKYIDEEPVKSFRDNMEWLKMLLLNYPDISIVLDISVFSKRYLFMLLRWLDDKKFWNRLAIVYSEPDDYIVSKYIPLSFGLSSLQQIPGFSACPNMSRSVHLVLFLGYEGDRALSVYEHIQPMCTTLIIPHPPFKPDWAGRTEDFNSDLLNLVGRDSMTRVDSIDPDNTKTALEKIFKKCEKHGEYAKIICPLGTKPQCLGIYSYLRECSDSPAILYAYPLRKNHELYSHGIGNIWLLKKSEIA